MWLKIFTTETQRGYTETRLEKKGVSRAAILDIKITLAAETPLLIAALEIQLQPKLNVTCGTCSRDCPEARGRYYETWCAEIRPVKGIEHICLEPEVKALSKIELFTEREIERDQIGTLRNAYTTISSSSRRRRRKRSRIDPTIWSRVRKEHWTTNVVRSTSSDGCIASYCEVRATLVSSDATHFPS
jgi:hypothetical protein